jgi:hypothetical protein
VTPGANSSSTPSLILSYRGARMDGMSGVRGRVVGLHMAEAEVGAVK